MTSMTYLLIGEVFFSHFIFIVVFGELMMLPDDLLCFEVAVLTPDLFFMEMIIVDLVRLERDFDHISFLYFLFDFIEVCLGISISVFDRLHFLQMVLLKITIHLFAMNYNKFFRNNTK